MDAKPPGWRPVLDGELAAGAEAAVTEIAAALAAHEPLAAPDLASGSTGSVLLFHYLDRARPGQGHDERAGRFLESAIGAIAGGGIGVGLHDGFTGVAWAAEHVGGSVLDEDTEDANDSVDAVLADLLAGSPWTGPYDLMTGLAGMAVYALERAHRASARRCLELVLERLEETAERAPGGVTWKTGAHRLRGRQRDDSPDGSHNAGVAHGVPGVVTVLAAMVAAGVGGGRARALLEGAVDWLLAARLADGSWPYLVGPGIEAHPARMAWCYGDPGVAAALLAAARAAGEPAWEREAMAAAHRAAAFDPARREDVKDAGLCHGAAGVAHLFNRIHHTTGDAVCGDAARRWFARALALRRPGCAVAGFPAWGPLRSDPDGPPVWSADASFLTGAAGVALALLGGLTAIEPAWDRCLAASLAGRRSRPSRG